MRLKNWWFKGLNSDMTKSIVHGSIQAIYIFLTEIQCTRVQYSGKLKWPVHIVQLFSIYKCFHF